MRVLVAGATGFIGGKLCAMLAQADYEVIALSREPDRARRHLPMLSAAFPWSPTQGPPPPEAFDNVDVVVNLVGESVSGRWTSAKRRRLYDSRVMGTRNLVSGIRALQQRPRLLVNGSAYGYYGDRGDEELTELKPPGNDFLAHICKDWEAAAVEAEALGVRVVRARNALVVGPNGGFLKPLVPLYRWGLGGPLGSGRQWWSWVHISDVARFIIYAIEHEDVTGPVNVVAPAALRQRDFAKTLGRVLGRPAVAPAPAFAVKLILGGLAVEVLSSRRLVPQAAREAGYAFMFPYLEAALRDALGRPEATDFQDGRQRR